MPTHVEIISRLLDQRDELSAALVDMLEHFAHHTTRDGRHALATGGLSTLEDAFAALGWSDPHIVEETDMGDGGEEGTLTCDTCGRSVPARQVDQFTWDCPACQQARGGEEGER